MAVASVEIKKFDGNGGCLMEGKNQGLARTTKDSQIPFRSLRTSNNTHNNTKGKNGVKCLWYTLILNLSDNVIRQILEEDTAHKIWKKLENLYAIKDLPNKMYMREKFFTYKMDPSNNLTDNLDEKYVVSEFKSLEDKLIDDNEAFVLLNSVPEAYKEVKNALKYDRDSVKTDAIILALRTRELKIQ